MSNKKIKNSLFDKVQNIVNESTNISVETEIKDNSDFFKKQQTLPNNIVEQLKQFEILKKENIKLIKENSKLNDELAKLYELNDQLNSSKILKLENEISTLTEKLNLVQLNADKYLTKISELEFENAKLNNLKNTQNPIKCVNISPQKNINKSTNSSNNVKYIKTQINWEGYNSWN